MTIRERRRELGMTLGELARACHLGTSVISQIERGNLTPPEIILKDIGKHLKWTVDEVRAGMESPPAPAKYILKLAIMVVFASPFASATPVLDWQTPALVTPGLHENFDVALPADLTNQSGLTLDELTAQFPQNAFAFNGHLVGYFDPNRPAAIPHWTVKAQSEEPMPTPEPGTIVAGLVAAALAFSSSRRKR